MTPSLNTEYRDRFSCPWMAWAVVVSLLVTACESRAGRHAAMVGETPSNIEQTVLSATVSCIAATTENDCPLCSQGKGAGNSLKRIERVVGSSCVSHPELNCTALNGHLTDGSHCIVSAPLARIRLQI